MINKVIVTNHQDETLVMDLWNPYESGFAVTRIDGVNPAKATVNSTELSTSDGAVYNSSRLESRNIVITVKILDSPQSIEEGRRLLYRYFPQKHKITLAFQTDNRDCYIQGYVESNDAEYFSSMTAAQISIICPVPYLRWTDNDVTYFSGEQPMFEFLTTSLDIPGTFENPIPDDTAIVNNLTISEMIVDTIRDIDYTGEIDAGLVMTIHFIGHVEGTITIYNYDRNYERMTLDLQKIAQVVGGEIRAGDDIIVDTIQGEKNVLFLRDGIYTNILNCVNRDATWLVVTKGRNIFGYTVYDKTGAVNLQYLYNTQFIIENPVYFAGV